MMGNKDLQDEKILQDIQRSLEKVVAWDDDPNLLRECRLMIPFESLISPTEEKSKYFREDDILYNGDALFLKRLVLFFQKDVMSWVDKPCCEYCGAANECMRYSESRGPQSLEEREGQAGRVEGYTCELCSRKTLFPRYNSVRKLLETRKGRCGEFANLFGLYCRAAGFETRYVMDWTDHVWIEVLVEEQWVMADSCEGIMNKPSMYEFGWGKNLNLIVAISTDLVVDVTTRYTRKFQDPSFQNRRRDLISSEEALERIISQIDLSLRNGLSKSRIQVVDRLALLERATLSAYRTFTMWTEDENHGKGRISGSRDWKVSRGEEGKTYVEGVPLSHSYCLHVEQFLPRDEIEVSVFPKEKSGIIISGANCDLGRPESISVVVIDDVHFGCVLLCRSFSTWDEVGSFITTVPKNRIIALKGSIMAQEGDHTTRSRLHALGGFKLPESDGLGVMYIGQVEASPEWATCCAYTEVVGISIKFQNVYDSPLKLKQEKDTVPFRILGRLPETIMALDKQIVVTEEQKKNAFLSYASEVRTCVGYTTKPGCPIYLLENSSFPFQALKDWTTYHFLPEPFLCNQLTDSLEKNTMTKFPIPVDNDFFVSQFGSSLLKNIGSVATSFSCESLISNHSLIGIYFSAHWCPPCRRFTAVLIEAYNIIKEIYPEQGLEILFVTSDRTESDFGSYFSSMPWCALPYDEACTRRAFMSRQYGVRGIPSLVILDAVSGEIVADINRSRTDVLMASQKGEEGVQDLMKLWLSLVPSESQDLIRTLEASCLDDESNFSPITEFDDYLVKIGARRHMKDDLATETTEVMLTVNNDDNKKCNPHSQLYATARLQKQENSPCQLANDIQLANIQRSIDLIKGKPNAKEIFAITTQVLKTFVDNLSEAPWNHKIRSMKLANKVVDRMTRHKEVLGLIYSLGMRVKPTSQDFVLTIPLAIDIEFVQQSLTRALAPVDE
jgi:peptide-N4-(N-acetyl-beta-glucosaminyl)asparagine amidase